VTVRIVIANKGPAPIVVREQIGEEQCGEICTVPSGTEKEVYVGLGSTLTINEVAVKKGKVK
jgi:hypothetical protein